MTENSKGKVVSVNGNLLAVEFDGDVSMNEICYVKVGGRRAEKRGNPHTRHDGAGAGV